jgi:ABC-type oligopeptide transport system substrate-binding subunit
MPRPRHLSADYPDPHGYLDLLFHTDSRHNSLSYSNPGVDSLLEQARVQQDASLRLEMYEKAERLIVGDAAWLPLWHPGDGYVLVKPHVRGFKFAPHFTSKFKDVYIEH